MQCPECGNRRIWRDGVRSNLSGEIQRFLCRLCGYRFSESAVKLDVAGEPREGSDHVLDSGDVHAVDFLPTQKRFNNSLLSLGENVGSQSSQPLRIPTARKLLNTSYPHSKDYRVRASKGEAKNLVKVESRIEKRAAGATKLTEAHIKGKIVEYLWYMKKQGYAESTIKTYVIILKVLAKRGADLNNAESVKRIIAQQENWGKGRKWNVVKAYSLFLKMQGLTWEKPKYKPVEKFPFIPTEKEIDELIAGCSKQMATFLQVLKETGARRGEAFDLKWTDIDQVQGTIRVTPEKGSSPRVFKISNKLAEMLSNLPKTSDCVWIYKNAYNLGKGFVRQRKRVAHKLANARILQIHCHTLRHWKATMEYAKTKDILYVQKLLGHRNLKTTLRYTQLVAFPQNEEYICKAANTVKEAKELVEAGFEYVTDMDSCKLFRKRKTSYLG